MTEVQKIIRKHFNPKFKRLNWATCGYEIEKLIRKKEDSIRAKGLQYTKECNKIDQMRDKINGEYEQYFSFTNIYGVTAGYDWVNGNDKLKELLG